MQADGGDLLDDEPIRHGSDLRDVAGGFNDPEVTVLETVVGGRRGGCFQAFDDDVAWLKR